MGAQFTPGPWRVEDGTTLVWGACNSADHYGMGYPVTSAMKYGSEFREDEAEANARLIAAAPELYEAAQLAVDYDKLLREYEGPLVVLTAGDDAKIDAAYDAWRDATMLALAKVAGE